jgi:hypothetical protein
MPSLAQSRAMPDWNFTSSSCENMKLTPKVGVSIDGHLAAFQASAVRLTARAVSGERRTFEPNENLEPGTLRETQDRLLNFEPGEALVGLNCLDDLNRAGINLEPPIRSGAGF